MVDRTDRRAHHYRACSRDAFKLVERETPAQRPGESDRGCPLGTVLVPPLWHASGTAGEYGRRLSLEALGFSSGDGLGPSRATRASLARARRARGRPGTRPSPGRLGAAHLGWTAGSAGRGDRLVAVAIAEFALLGSTSRPQVRKLPTAESWAQGEVAW
jgi:hypothetical protein